MRRLTERDAKNLDCRESSLLTLIGRKWTASSLLARRARGGNAWRDARSGVPLSHASLRVVVHRILDKLETRRLIRSRMRRIGAILWTREVCLR